MQVDPVKPELKAPGSKRLKPKCDNPPSNFAFNLKLRRYILAELMHGSPILPGQTEVEQLHKIFKLCGRAYTPPLFGSQ